ncbi:MAG TPA: RNA polymerase sigma factor [Cyclobacteriaceae bacterium]|nr:RNA polymerase sigma factor [Cyclobacteriaceae bacterium]
MVWNKKDSISQVDSELVEGLKNSQSNSIKIIYNTCYPVIKSLVLRNSGTEYEAKDIFQDSLILLFEKLQQPEFRLRCSIKTFIYAVSKRLWLKRWNEQKVKIYDTQFETEPQDMENLIQSHENHDLALSKMMHAIGELGEPCATILKDFYLRDLTMNDIAAKFGYTNSENAKTQKYKCLQRLKKLFFYGEQENHAEL